MEADPWRSAVVEDSAGHSSASHTATPLAWTRSSETFNPAVAAPAPASTLDASLAWDPTGDEVDSVWTWQPTSTPKPASPKWEPVAFETKAWSPPPLNDAPSREDEGLPEIIPKSTTPTPSLPPVSAELSSPWSGVEEPRPSSAADVHRPRTPTPSPSTSAVQQDPAVPSSPQSPDGFGSFEVATESHAPTHDANISWSVTAGARHSDEATPSWGLTIPTAEPSAVGPKDKDEWQLATAAREQRDLVAPPHVVNGWIKELQSLLDGMWKPPETDDALPDWRSSSSILDDVSSMVDTMLPPLHLERPPDISKSAIHKASIAALKSTRHSVVARSSPLAIFHAMRGSTLWEESVKKHVNPIAEGWGIFDTVVEPAPSRDSKAEPTIQVKKPSGLLSFFSRRDGVPATSASSPATTLVSTSVSAQTIASVRPTPESGQHNGAESESVPIEKTTSEDAGPLTTSTNTSTSSGEVAKRRSSPTSGHGIHPDFTAQSAVSRFLGRFSRNTGGPDLHKSLSLSDTGVSFLSDAIPDAAERKNISPSLDPFEFNESLLGLPSSTPNQNSITPPLPPPFTPSQSSIRTPITATPYATPGAPPADLAPAFSSTMDGDAWDVFTSAPKPVPSLLSPISIAGPPPPHTQQISVPTATDPAAARRTVPVRMLPSVNRSSFVSTIPAITPPPKRVITPVPRSFDLSADTRDTTSPSRTTDDVTTSPISVCSQLSADDSIGTRRVPPHAAGQPTHTPGTANSSLLLNHDSGFPDTIGAFEDFTTSSPSRTVPLPSQLLAVATSITTTMLPRRTVDAGQPAKPVSGSSPRQSSRTSSTSSPTIPATIVRPSTNGSGTVSLNFDFLRTASPNMNSQSNAHGTPSQQGVAAGARPPVGYFNITPIPPPLVSSSHTSTPPISPPSPILPSAAGTAALRMQAMTPSLSPQLTGGLAKPSASTVPAGRSGLSAQDLSFFENL